MRRLLTSTAALSIAFAPINPWPLVAQTLTETGSIVTLDGTVLCEPTAEAPCLIEDYGPEGLLVEDTSPKAKKKKKARDAVAEALQANEAEAAAGVEADAAADAETQAAKKAKRKAAAAAAAEADAAAAAQADADATAAAAAAEAQSQAAADAAAAAQAAAAATAEAEARAAADAAAAAEAEAAKAAKAEARAAAKAAAKAEAQAAAAAEASAAAAAEAAAAVEEENRAAEATAAAIAAEAKAAELSATATAAEADAAVAVEADTSEPVITETTEAPAVEPVVEEPMAVDVTTEDPATEATTVEGEAEATVDPTKKTRKQRAAEAAALKAAQEELVVDPAGELVDPAAGLKTEVVTVDPNAVPVEAPKVSETEVETLSTLLGDASTLDPTTLGAAVTVLTDSSTEPKADGSSNEPVAEPVPLTEASTSPDAVSSVITVLTEGDTRTSSEEFTAAPVTVAPGKKSGLSDLEKVGLFALGALAIGAIIKGANDRADAQVVSNTGDRVVVLNPDGSYSVYKDDDTVLRTPGSTVRTETFADGSTRTIVQRTDGTQVVTIRDATGRVLRRATYDSLGREIVLIDDMAREVPVVVTQLPRPQPDRITISAKDQDAVLKAKLAAIEAGKSGRTFSLRQVREIPEVRALAATIDAGNVTFDSGSSAIKATEADELADLGSLMQDLLEENPAEMFLIEGHTDAVGKAAMNLALSDRRAESVGLALAEYFEIPPENMVIQGYGEGELLINTLDDERRNRRVAVRVITPLLRAAAN